LTKRIAFIGPAGCGKSTAAEELSVTLKKKHINVELISEWVRADIHLNGPMESTWEQYRTRSYQKELEDAVPDNVDFIVTDSGVLTPYFYACLYADNTNSRQRLVLQDMYRYLLDDIYLRRYDHVFYLPTTETYKVNKNILGDGTRYQSQSEIDTLEMHMNLVFTRLHNLDNIHTLTCPLNKRVGEVLKTIGIDK